MYASIVSLAKRIIVPITASTTPAQAAEIQRDPWSQSGKYALSWTYFSVALVVMTILVRIYNVWGDRIRIALYKESPVKSPYDAPHGSEQELASAATDSSTTQFFPSHGTVRSSHQQQSSVSTIAPLNNTIALLRWVFYRPIPTLKMGRIHFVFPSMGVTALVLAAVIFATLYCFLPQPLYHSSISLGSPPLAIRAGMIALAMIPWIVALGTKANVLSLVTGIGHERLNVVHRWLGYLCLFMSLVHMVPFYVTPVWDDGAFALFSQYLIPQGTNIYIYGTGLAAFAPLAFLCVHSLPFLRAKTYELFAYTHGPIAVIFLGMLIWHTKNYLLSWNYIWATIAVWVFSYCTRALFLNWFSPLRLSWLIGEESAVTILPENAVKVTIPTQMRWRPGQYVYLRMPGISPFENHPFTIASLCSDDFPSNYGAEYRDMALVFRPFGGFTRKVLDTARRKGPYKIYRAFLDGPYGGMQRELAAFDDVIFFAGGSGITAIASQLLNLIKKMRDGKAVTKNVRVIWALKRPDAMEWFKEELRICREFAPPNSMHCRFFLTSEDRTRAAETVNEILQGIPSKRNSAWIREEAAGDPDREKELRRENEDAITALPGASYMTPGAGPSQQYNPYAQFYPNPYTPMQQHPSPLGTPQSGHGFDFGFHPPSPGPAQTRNTLTRFAFLPRQKQDSWRTEYGRPNVTQMLREYSKDCGRRTCVFVCGPPSLRVEVTQTVARLQQLVMSDSSKDEIFLHAENYAI
jgi:predicted ferric reductase